MSLTVCCTDLFSNMVIGRQPQFYNQLESS